MIHQADSRREALHITQPVSPCGYPREIRLLANLLIPKNPKPINNCRGEKRASVRERREAIEAWVWCYVMDIYVLWCFINVTCHIHSLLRYVYVDHKSRPSTLYSSARVPHVCNQRVSDYLINQNILFDLLVVFLAVILATMVTAGDSHTGDPLADSVHRRQTNH